MLNYMISDSGYPIYHLQIPGAPICKVEIVASCGSAHEDPDSWGVAHFLEHMCFQGTPTKNKHQVSRDQSLVGDYNAYTNYFNTAYHFDSLNDDFEQGLSLLKEAVFDSSYPEAEFEKEKSVIVEEWRMYDNYPTQHFFDYVLGQCYGKAEAHPIIGTEDSIRGMNPDKLHRFRNKWYGKDNIFIVVVGDLSFERVMEAVNNTLPIARGVEKAPTCLSEFLATDSKYNFNTDRFEQAAFGLVYKWPSPETIIKDDYVANFFHWALHKYMNEYIRDDLGLCYGVGGSNFRHYDNSSFMISMLTSNNHLEKAETELENLFQKIKDKGFPDEVFQICKKQQLYVKVKSLQDVHGVLNSIVSGVMSSNDPSWYLNDGQKVLNLDWLKSSAESLTPKSLQDFANKWLDAPTKFAMSSTKNLAQ